MTGPVHHGWLYRRFVLPIFAMLRMGATPEKLAWSLAAGLMIGINPLLGSTTFLCLAVAFAFRLNVAASQLANHIVYPLELVLVVPFIRLGSRFFGTAALPFSSGDLVQAVRANPVAVTRQLWMWEWHALVLWAAVAVVGTPLLVLVLTPILRKLLVRVERHQYPIAATVPED